MNPTKKLELDFRHELARSMADFWIMSWHEDGGISPGTPDLHYVMRGPHDKSYRVGWLELKACAEGRISFEIEPSQHAFIKKWHQKMPIHFLISIGDLVYLIEARFHVEISRAKSESDLLCIPCRVYSKRDTALRLAEKLREITVI